MKNKEQYTILPRDCNGPQRPLVIKARSLRAAKIAATKYSAGTTTYVLVIDETGNVVASRSACDSYRGFCCGMNRWD